MWVMSRIVSLVGGWAVSRIGPLVGGLCLE